MKGTQAQIAALEIAINRIKALYNGVGVSASIVHPEQRLYIDSWVLSRLNPLLASLKGEKSASADLSESHRRGYYRIDWPTPDEKKGGKL
jgi:hypothetical protein